jgi:hypothetical protein
MKFSELAAVNVNEHIEKKNNLSYLSWAWAVDYMSRLDESSEWEYREWDGKPYLKLPDETCMVYCTVTFGGRKRTAHLPVMDHRNKAIQNPDAFQINTAMQRALVKAISLHGLGLYIYAGEDLPKDEADKKEEVKPITNGAKITPTAGAKDNISPEQRAKVDKIVSAVTDWLNSGSVADAVLTKENAGLDADETVYFWTKFDSKQRAAMKREFQVMKLENAAKNGMSVENQI